MSNAKFPTSETILGALKSAKATRIAPVPNPRGKAPLDKKGKPMTRMCPWCSYPMKPFLEGWLTCTHCNATDPVTPDPPQPKVHPRKLKTPSDKGGKNES
jgi:hypothetical protein